MKNLFYEKSGLPIFILTLFVIILSSGCNKTGNEALSYNKNQSNTLSKVSESIINLDDLSNTIVFKFSGPYFGMPGYNDPNIPAACVQILGKDDNVIQNFCIPRNSGTDSVVLTIPSDPLAYYAYQDNPQVANKNSVLILPTSLNGAVGSFKFRIISPKLPPYYDSGSVIPFTATLWPSGLSWSIRNSIGSSNSSLFVESPYLILQPFQKFEMILDLSIF